MGDRNVSGPFGGTVPILDASNTMLAIENMILDGITVLGVIALLGLAIWAAAGP